MAYDGSYDALTATSELRTKTIKKYLASSLRPACVAGRPSGVGVQK